MEQNFLLSIGEEKNLPVYLSYIGENEYQPHVVRPRGFHCAQIIFCTEGEGCLSIGGKEYTVTDNMTFYLPPKVPHEYKAAGNGKHQIEGVAGGKKVYCNLTILEFLFFSITNSVKAFV